MKEKSRKIEKVVQKFSVEEQPKASVYWLTRSPEERLAALESIRNEYHGEDLSKQRLQRVCRIIKLQ